MEREGGVERGRGREGERERERSGTESVNVRKDLTLETLRNVWWERHRESEMMKKERVTGEMGRKMLVENKAAESESWGMSRKQELRGRKRGVLLIIALEALINTGPYLSGGTVSVSACHSWPALSLPRCAMPLSHFLACCNTLACCMLSDCDQNVKEDHTYMWTLSLSL